MHVTGKLMRTLSSSPIARRLSARRAYRDRHGRGGFGTNEKYGSDDMLGLGKALAIFTVLYLASPASLAFAETADTVLFNGKILTVEGFFGPAGAGDRARPGKSDRC